MSWYGSHPRYQKDVIKSLLPAAPCKLCVYWFRVVVGSSPDSWSQKYQHCTRCGIPQWELFASLNERLAGMATPPQPRGPRSTAEWEGPRVRPTGSAALDQWLRLYESRNMEVRVRAAEALLERPDIPMPVLLDVMDHLFLKGLGKAVELALFKRDASEVVGPMIDRLGSDDQFIRETACRVLGRSGDFSATPHLLRMIDDPHLWVRRTAGFALAFLMDPSSIPELKRQLAARRDDDTNVVWALESALQALGVDDKGE